MKTRILICACACLVFAQIGAMNEKIAKELANITTPAMEHWRNCLKPQFVQDLIKKQPLAKIIEKSTAPTSLVSWSWAKPDAKITIERAQRGLQFLLQKNQVVDGVNNFLAAIAEQLGKRDLKNLTVQERQEALRKYLEDRKPIYEHNPDTPGGRIVERKGKLGRTKITDPEAALAELEQLIIDVASFFYLMSIQLQDGKYRGFADGTFQICPSASEVKYKTTALLTGYFDLLEFLGKGPSDTIFTYTGPKGQYVFEESKATNVFKKPSYAFNIMSSTGELKEKRFLNRFSTFLCNWGTLQQQLHERTIWIKPQAYKGPKLYATEPENTFEIKLTNFEEIPTIITQEFEKIFGKDLKPGDKNSIAGMVKYAKEQWDKEKSVERKQQIEAFVSKLWANLDHLDKRVGKEVIVTDEKVLYESWRLFNARQVEEQIQYIQELYKAFKKAFATAKPKPISSETFKAIKKELARQTFVAITQVITAISNTNVQDDFIESLKQSTVKALQESEAARFTKQLSEEDNLLSAMMAQKK